MATDAELWLVGTFTQAILFGLYLVTLFQCLRCIWFLDEGWKLRDRVNWLTLTTTLTLFAFATVDLVISIYICLLTIVGGKENDFYSHKLDIVNCIIENTSLLISDAILIYRCWMVHTKSWRVISLPILLWLSCLASSILILFYELKCFPNSPTESWANALKYRADNAFYVCNIANNIYATSAIVYRILRVANNRVGGSRRLFRIGRIIAESGIICAISSVMLLISYVGAAIGNKSFVFAAIAFDALNFSMAIISFNLIIIRVNKQRAEDEADTLLGSERSQSKEGVTESRFLHVEDVAKT